MAAHARVPGTNPRPEVGCLGHQAGAACERSISQYRKFVDCVRICVRNWYGTCPASGNVSRKKSRPAPLAAVSVDCAHEYDTNGSDVPWKSIAGASPADTLPTTR